MKNKKAISPVLAVLLMIAVAVAAALITYAWVMTYLSSTTSRAGHAIQIQSVDFAGAKIYAQNVGDGALVPTDVYENGALKVTGLTTPLPEGDTVELAITGTYLSADEVHIRIVCEDGTFTEGTYTVP